VRHEVLVRRVSMWREVLQQVPQDGMSTVRPIGEVQRKAHPALEQAMTARYLHSRPSEAAADVLRELNDDARLTAEGFPDYLAALEAEQEAERDARCYHGVLGPCFHCDQP
jgi:hypothetical protein